MNISPFRKEENSDEYITKDKILDYLDISIQLKSSLGGGIPNIDLKYHLCNETDIEEVWNFKKSFKVRKKIIDNNLTSD